MNSFKAQVLLNKVTSANFRDPPNVKCSFTDGPSSEKIKEVFIKRGNHQLKMITFFKFLLITMTRRMNEGQLSANALHIGASS